MMLSRCRKCHSKLVKNGTETKKRANGHIVVNQHYYCKNCGAQPSERIKG